MQKKLFSTLIALFFPLLYMFVRMGTQTAAFYIILSNISVREPDAEWANNQAQLAFRALSPWLLTISAAITLLLIALLLRFTGVRFYGERQRLRPFTVLTLCEIGLGLNLALNAMVVLLPLPEAWLAEHADSVSDPLGAAGFAAQFICTVLAAPLVEEVIFRGFAFRFFRRGFSPEMAILWQAILFAAFHGTKLQIIYVFPAAIVLGLVYHWSGTLVAPLALHMAFNAFSLLSVPLPSAGWGQWLCLLAGTGITVLGLQGVHKRTRSNPLRTSE